MLTEPMIVERDEQPYLGLRTSVTMEGISGFLDASFPTVFAHMEATGIRPSGPPFVRYHVIDMDGVLDIEVGVPVASAATGTDRVVAGVLPAGRYGTLTYTGPYDGLVDANEALQQWAERQGLHWAMSETDAGDWFASRIEVYLTDPASEPDPQKWETEVAYLLADAETAG
jgi:effector-binding domain-containing protein